MKASCAALMLFSATAGTAWAGLLDSPAGGTLPSTISPVGGIVVDIVGLNGTRLMTVVDAGSLLASGTTTTSSLLTIGTATGFTSEQIASLGGGIASASIRISLWDGNSTSDDYWYGKNSLYINGTSYGNFSSVSTVETSSSYSRVTSGTSYYRSTTGTTALSTGTGFGGAILDTGYFSITGTSSLASLYSALKTGTLTFAMSDTSGGNYVYFNYAYAGSQYESVGYLPGINSPTLVLSNTWNTPTSLDYTAQYNTITTENCTIRSLTFTPSSTLTLSGTLTISSGDITANAGGSSVITGGYLYSPTSFNFNTAGNQQIGSVIIGDSDVVMSGTGVLLFTGANTYTGETVVNRGALVVGDGTSGSINTTSNITIGGSGTLAFNMAANAVSTPTINNSGIVESIGANTLTISGTISGSGSFYQNGTGTTFLTGSNTYTGATVVNAGTLWIGDGVTGSVASTSALLVGASATLVLASPSDTLWSHSIADNGTVVFQGPSASYTYTGVVSGSGGIIKAGNNTLTVSTAQAYTGLTLVSAGTLVMGGDNLLVTQSQLQISAGATFDLGDYSQSLSGITGSGTVLTGSDTILTVGANNGSSTFSGVISGSGTLVKSGAGTFVIAGQEDATGGITVESGTLVVSGSTVGDVSIESAGRLLVTGSLGGDVTDAGILVVNGTVDGNVDVSGYLGGSGLIVGNVTNDAIVSPGNSPGTLTISGNYTQSSAGTLYIQIASATVYDKLVVSGSAVLGGTLAVTSSKQLRTEYTILTADAGVSGSFASISADSFLKFSVQYNADSVTLEPYYRYLSIVSGLTANEYAVAKAMDNAIDSPELYNYEKLVTLATYLNALPDANLPGAFELMVPTDYVILPDATFSLTQVQTSNLELRMEQIRSDYVDYTASIDAGRTTDGTQYIDPQGRNLTPVPLDRAWSFFLNGSGETVSDKCSAQYDNGKYTTSGVSAGADYRWDSYDIPFAAGLTVGYANTSLDGRGDGHSDIDSGDITAYATAFKNGWFVNGILGGGMANYDLKRQSLGGIARGSTSGLNLNAALGGGYSYTVGGFSAGPIASLRYTNVQIDSFTEQGSMSPLNIHDQSRSSIKTLAGVQVSYEFPIETVLVKPHARLQWRHEYNDDSRDISANFQIGDAFTVTGESLGSDSFLVDLGATVRFTPVVSAYAYYLGDIGSSNYTSNAVVGGMQLSF
ncbi:MAG: autotransporter domain-containing protein [Chthoniobacteraceae bacterium]